ncbi:MAG: DUF4835 family protein [Paraprevotella sp.]|nr:DUF4835 family protein [Paraprevotella sp.]
MQKMSFIILRLVFVVISFLLLTTTSKAQELNAKIVINRSQISNTTEAVFEALNNSLTAFMNEREWTEMEYEEVERINCTFNITLKTYSETDNSFTGSLQVQSTRPVYNSNYNSTVFQFQDENFNFNFQQFDQLEFRPEQVDNNLTAMLAFYAYLIIGMDMDTMAPLGGTDVLQMAMDVANNSQNLGYAGWKAFDSDRNRFAIINDYLDGSMEPLRQLEYEYHRKGLDRMEENTDTARAQITQAMTLLSKAREQKTMSALPVIFTDIKRDELVSIYSGKGTPEERQKVYDIVFRINASQSNYWEKLKK